MERHQEGGLAMAVAGLVIFFVPLVPGLEWINIIFKNQHLVTGIVVFVVGTLLIVFGSKIQDWM